MKWNMYYVAIDCGMKYNGVEWQYNMISIKCDWISENISKSHLKYGVFMHVFLLLHMYF